MKKAKTTSMPIQSLPDELLQKLMKVASRYLFLAKMVCKKFNQIVEDDHIFEHVNIREFEGFNPLTSWTNKEDCGNSYALYMLGMTYFFQDNKKEVRIEATKMAISKDHEVATYVYGFILLSSWCLR
ncbi:F-box protein [Pyrus ussuriensis x Pyrus communis]|uniref:F-box protein n=1 Tax=Pyrus ussuriensis x Pyrus communis TaxID=2448454 RepID=A0A5N5GTT2_9ROSA|nr:F-box protein [Pyrus ussuriensis x Pyrus communis]